MKEEIPKCKDCGQPMFEIGETGRTIQYADMEGKRLCQRSQKLYQCPECKTIVID